MAPRRSNWIPDDSGTGDMLSSSVIGTVALGTARRECGEADTASSRSSGCSLPWAAHPLQSRRPGACSPKLPDPVSETLRLVPLPYLLTPRSRCPRR